ncbi:hypothetical protein CA13_22790 [Planctomycetes bacterium CA13]|uniref:Uncharacterized protein n=1 Tax=Novipirellula herctigrandis TaxID=2527986 RepID=A0A5C5Z2J2_9BACT|nr:hypothetical protein CA13_22790 [Planctomycetes bacterium CA13]
MSVRRKRRIGFSLMEMIIATAVLAGSGAALFALVGQASQLARRAEERTVALQFAQSVLDEYLAMQTEIESDSEGTFESDPRWNYKVETFDIEASKTIEASQTPSTLKRIVVSIYRADENGGLSVTDSDSAIVRLVRWNHARAEMVADDGLMAEPELP